MRRCMCGGVGSSGHIRYRWNKYGIFNPNLIHTMPTVPGDDRTLACGLLGVGHLQWWNSALCAFINASRIFWTFVGMCIPCACIYGEAGYPSICIAISLDLQK